MGRRLGDPDDPLLVSVRSGAKFSMPGMMETVLNIGLNDAVGRRAWPRQSGDERFAWDSYRRLIQMFGKTVLGIDGDAVRGRARRGQGARKGVTDDLDLDADDLRELVDDVQGRSSREHTGRDFPQDPREQLRPGGPRGLRLVEHRPGAALPPPGAHPATTWAPPSTSCAMVFGNLGADSGTGVAFTRDPATGAQGVYGDYLQNAQGEDVVAGIRNTVPLADLEQIDKASLRRAAAASWRRSRPTTATCATSSSPSSAASCGCCRPGSASAPPAAAFRIAVQLVDEGLIDLDEALQRVTGAQLAQLMFPQFDAAAERTLLATGMTASPGRGGRQGGLRLARPRSSGPSAGEEVILVRRETNPDDLRRHDRRRRASSPAAAARPRTPPWSPAAWARPACAAPRRSTSTPSAAGSPRRTARVVNEGDVISIDGTTGEVFLGAVPVVPSPGGAVLRGRRWTPRRDDPLVAAVDRLHGARRRSAAGWRCAPTPTPPRTPPGPAASARRASACAAPSTCSSATAASWSSG